MTTFKIVFTLDVFLVLKPQCIAKWHVFYIRNRHISVSFFVLINGQDISSRYVFSYVMSFRIIHFILISTAQCIIFDVSSGFFYKYDQWPHDSYMTGREADDIVKFYIALLGVDDKWTRYIVTVCVFVCHVFSYHPFYFDFHSAMLSVSFFVYKYDQWPHDSYMTGREADDIVKFYIALLDLFPATL
jgi:hypothetical protein